MRQVQRTRANWQGPSSQHTFVCSDHFTDDSFEMQFRLKLDMGIKSLRRLKSDAVPTLFTHKENPQATKPKRPRTGYEKRERNRIVMHALSSSAAAATDHDATLDDTDMTEDADMTEGYERISCSIACQTTQSE